MRAGRAALAAVVLLLLAACKPAPSPVSPPPSCGRYPGVEPTRTVQNAILEAWGHWGQNAVNEAGRVACCESSWLPWNVSPDGTYKGLFQLGPHVVAINAYGGNFFDARQNALAARDRYSYNRTHGLPAWSGWSCRP